MEIPDDALISYNPEIFVALKQWLTLIPELWQNSEKLQQLQPSSIEVLTAMDVEKAIEHSLQISKNQAAFIKQMHIWFDGFKTLKFVHGLEKSTFPPRHIKNIAVSENG
jgi:hypothetical protein